MDLPHYQMKDREFSRLSQLVQSECGIHLAPIKKTMLSTRLLKRLRALEIASFSDYYDYVTSPEGRRFELPHMIDVVSTNKTEFFREPVHFEFLRQHVLPELGPRRRLRIWSAGCSSGEEPYTLAMVVAEWSAQHGPLSLSILATDISHRILDTAKRAIYDQDCLRGLPPQMARRYFMWGKGPQAGLIRVVPELRARVAFRWLNLMEPFTGVEEMEVIFCRNVLIYFDRRTQLELTEKFARQLVPGGHLFLGHSETLNGINSPLLPVRPTIYQRPC